MRAIPARLTTITLIVPSFTARCAPSGKANRMWRHSRYRREHLELRRAIRALVRESRQTMATSPPSNAPGLLTLV